LRNGFKKWDRKVTGYKPPVSTKWTEDQLSRVTGVRMDYLEAMAMGRRVTSGSILESFTWSSTPQGLGYWDSLCACLGFIGPAPLPQDAADFCRALYESRR